MLKRYHNKIINLFAAISLIQAQPNLSVVTYQAFPPELNILNINPSSIEWGVAGSFLLLDKIDNQLVSIGSLYGMQTVGGFGRGSFSFSEPIWVGVDPHGISIIDRLENKVIQLDYRLNYMGEINLEPKLYPDLATIDQWGRILIYSSQFHSVFSLEHRLLNKIPLIDLNRFSKISFCIKQLNVNENGDIGLLDCDSNFHLFSRHGEYKNSFTSNIKSGEFLVPLRNSWFVFNTIGEGESIIKKIKLQIPNVSLPVVDVKSLNRSLAVLSKDHILILNAKLK